MLSTFDQQINEHEERVRRAEAAVARRRAETGDRGDVEHEPAWKVVAVLRRRVLKPIGAA